MVRHLARGAAAVIALVSMLAGSAPAQAQATGIDPQAIQLLRRMTDYVAGLKQFSVDSDSTLEVVLKTGEKLQFDTAASATVRRPDRMRTERRGEIVDEVFYYDGTSLTLHSVEAKRYAVAAPVPVTLDAALDYARNRLDIVAPASDLLASNAFARLTQDLAGAMVIGPSVTGGVKTTHLAFRGPEVDFQLWVQDGDKPLPRKYVITTRIEGMPEFASTFSNWKLDPEVPDALFVFVAPKEARRIDFLGAGSGGGVASTRQEVRK